MEVLRRLNNTLIWFWADFYHFRFYNTRYRIDRLAPNITRDTFHHAQDAIIGGLDIMDNTEFPNGFELTDKALNTARSHALLIPRGVHFFLKPILLVVWGGCTSRVWMVFTLSKEELDVISMCSLEYRYAVNKNESTKNSLDKLI